VQEETTALGIPCLTLPENTERPITLTHGTNRLVGCEPRAILEAALGTLENPPRARTLPSIVVLNGYDPTEFANHARFAHPRPYVLGVGRLAPEKGFDVLVEAFARLERTDHRPAPGR